MFDKPKRRNRFNFIKMFWAFDGEEGGGTPAAAPASSESSAAAPAADPAAATPAASYEAVSTAESSMSASIPSSATAPAPAAQTINWNETIPAEYRDKPYMQSILKSADPMTELIKQFDGLQTKLGQRPGGIPAHDAPQEEWDKYYEAARPKAADEYEIKPLDLGPEKKHLADFVNEHRDEQSLKELKGLMHKHGLTKRQAESLAADYDAWFANRLESQAKEHEEAGKKLNQEFDELAKKAFGTDIDNAILHGKKFIDMYMPEAMKPYKEGLPNEAAIIIAAMAKSVHDKYEKQDSFNGPTTTTAASETELRQEMRTLMALPAATNKFDPDHQHVRSQIDAITEQIVKLRKQK